MSDSKFQEMKRDYSSKVSSLILCLAALLLSGIVQAQSDEDIVQDNFQAIQEAKMLVNLPEPQFKPFVPKPMSPEEIADFSIATGLLLNFLVKNYPVPQYVLSGLALGVFALVGFLGSAREILLIRRLDYSRPVISFQVQLEKLKAYSLQTLRLILLSVPFYFAYIIISFKVLFNIDVYTNGNTNWIAANLVFSILLIPFSIWLYRKLSYQTKSKLVRKLLEDNGGKQINAALQFLNEIEAFKNE